MCVKCVSVCLGWGGGRFNRYAEGGENILYM